MLKSSKSGRWGILYWWWYIKIYRNDVDVSVCLSRKFCSVGFGKGAWRFAIWNAKEWSSGEHGTYYREDGIRVLGICFHLTHGWLLGKPFGGVGYSESEPNDRLYRVDDWDVPGQKPPPSGGIPPTFREAFA